MARGNAVTRVLVLVALAAAAGGWYAFSGEGNRPVVAVDDWSAITEQRWPEDGVPEDATLDTDPQRTNIVVVLDMSGSMDEASCAGSHASKAAAARAALGRWVEAVPREVNVALIAFAGNRIRTLVPLGTDNRAEFVEAARQVRPGGGTPLRSAMARAHELLAERARYQLGYGRYQIVMITDGRHSQGENPLPVVEEILRNPANPVEIHTIGFCIDDSALRQPGLVHYRSANDPEQLSQGLSSVLAESTSFQPAEDFDEQ